MVPKCQRVFLRAHEPLTSNTWPSTAPAKMLGSNRLGSSPARLGLLYTLSDVQNVSL